jgi:hypothetical protein
VLYLEKSNTKIVKKDAFKNTYLLGFRKFILQFNSIVQGLITSGIQAQQSLRTFFYLFRAKLSNYLISFLH